MSENGDFEKEMKRVDDALTTLMEHFDTVQIFATHHKGDDGTAGIARGRGNYYARMGQIREWMMKEDIMTEQQINEQQAESEDEFSG